MDHYVTLGVPRDATPEEIKKAYRKLAAIHHPDKGGDTKRFQEIQQAYDALTSTSHNNQYHIHRNPFEDLLRQYADNIRRKNYTVTVYVTLEQVAIGSIENIQLNVNGKQTLIQIQVPKGVEDNEQYKFTTILPDGTLLVTFKMHRNARFERNGLDLTTTVTVNMLRLIVGANVQVTDITGKVFDLTIPPNTKPDTKFRIKGRGLSNNNAIGDQYVLIKISLPDRISTELFEMIKLELTHNSKGTYAS